MFWVGAVVVEVKMKQTQQQLSYYFTSHIKLVWKSIQRSLKNSLIMNTTNLPTLLEFSKASGLLPNMNKSTAFFGNVDSNEMKRILEILPFSVGKLPVKYLGVPLITKRINAKECKQLIDKVKQRVNDRKNRYLSYA